MKGKTPSAEQKRYHDMLCNYIGCPACYIDTCRCERNCYVSIHHVDGRTKPNAHWLVIPICAGHHQDGYGPPGMLAVHGAKARFEAHYGTQRELMVDCARQLIEMGFDIPKTLQAILGLRIDK